MRTVWLEDCAQEEQRESEEEDAEAAIAEHEKDRSELNSGGEARPAVSGPRPALESAREHPTSSAAAAGLAEVIPYMCRSITRLP